MPLPTRLSRRGPCAIWPLGTQGPLRETLPKQSKSKENFLHLERIKDPDYYGFITYQNSGLLPLYKADGYKKLSSDELSEVIERLTDENSV